MGTRGDWITLTFCGLAKNWQNIQSQSSISDGENCGVQWHICNRILQGESERLMSAPCCRWDRTEGKVLVRRHLYRMESGWDGLVNRLPSALLVAAAAALRAQWGSGQLAHCLLKLITAFNILTNTDYFSRSGRPAECALYGAPHEFTILTRACHWHICDVTPSIV